MSSIIPTLLARLVLPLTAILGGLFFLAGSAAPLALADGACGRFGGPAPGNDPTQALELVLCRAGRTLTGFEVVQGDAGTGAFIVEGTVERDGTMRLRATDAIEQAPAAGWVMCADDAFVLRADDAGVLRGEVVSRECEDRAALALPRLFDAPPPGDEVPRSCRHGGPRPH